MFIFQAVVELIGKTTKAHPVKTEKQKKQKSPEK